eukprot:TRINITY_DN32209_c0_g1_i1.p1 TRINITY_DN32209_c0_g1~~TRINITY_DN32209_c0_g1_i1.p1  ORF type:complete len:212 (-),score=39.74 TRINITY_DN32209_c0_g1_i1:237-872(-)
MCIRDRMKSIPQNIPQDKEALYFELLQYKKISHNLKDQNTMLKSEQCKLVNKNSQLEKISQDIDYDDQRTTCSKFNNSSIEKSSYENAQLFTYKKQLQTLNSELKEKSKFIKELKKNIRYTKVEELKTEIIKYEEETKRLRFMLENSINQQKLQKEINDEQQNTQESTDKDLELIHLRSENIELTAQFNLLQEHNSQTLYQLQKLQKSQQK